MRWGKGVCLWAAGVMVVLSGCGRMVLTPPPTPTPTVGVASPTPRRQAGVRVLPTLPLTPLPPTPTFTPTPAPTPVVHTVEQGDTLLGIALEYGVSLDALLQANGLTVDEILHIGQTLIIPMEEEAAVGLAAPMENLLLPTPTPLPLEVVNVARYRTPTGGLWCMGEVLNSTEGPTTNMQVRVTLVTGEGMPLVMRSALVAADYLPVGKRAPFAVLFADPPEGVADAAVTVIRGEPVGEITAALVALALHDVGGRMAGPQYRVAGVVVNDAGGAVQRVTVVATIYDAEGRVQGYRQVVLHEEEPLAAGAEVPFALLLTPQGVEPPASFSVLAWGSRIGG